MIKISTFVLLAFLSSSNAWSQTLDFNFDILRACSRTEFKYEQVFLLAERQPQQKLTKNPFATRIIASQKLIPNHYKVVTEAYSIAPFRNYINYNIVSGFTKQLSVALVKDTARTNDGFSEFKDYPYDLILFVSDPDSTAFGVVLAGHPARMNYKILETFNFNCAPN